MCLSTERLGSNFPERKFSLPIVANQVKGKMDNIPGMTPQGDTISKTCLPFIPVPTDFSGNSLASHSMRIK